MSVENMAPNEGIPDERFSTTHEFEEFGGSVDDVLHSFEPVDGEEDSMRTGLPDESEGSPDESGGSRLEEVPDMAQLQKECEESRDKMLRAKAELLNYQKRMRRELEDVRQYAIQDFARSLLDVADNFHRAIDAVAENQDFDGLKTGVMMTRDQLISALRKHGVEAVESEGKPFDPNRHEAVMQEERSDMPPGTVIEELTRGYVIGDRLLRPSMVRISRAKTSPSTSEEGSDPLDSSNDDGATQRGKS